MKKLSLTLAAIIIALILSSCSKTDLGTNETHSEATPNPKGSNITTTANPAIVWRQPETINRTSIETFWVMDADGANKTRLYDPNITSGKTKKIYSFLGPHWSPDGGSICFTRTYGSTDHGLYKLNVTLVNGVPTATNVTKLLDGPSNNSLYSDSYWSFGATNEIIFIVKNKSDNLWRIQAISGNGGTPSTIYTAASGVPIRWITVSPDGSQIAFSSPEGTNRYLKVINRSDGSLAYAIQLNSLLGGLFDMDWARTSGSTTIAFYGTPLGTTTAKIFTMDLNNTGTLTERIGGRAPSWSPDDSKLVYSEIQTNPTNYIKTITISGGTVTSLGAGFGYTMHWKK